MNNFEFLRQKPLFQDFSEADNQRKFGQEPMLGLVAAWSGSTAQQPWIIQKIDQLKARLQLG